MKRLLSTFLLLITLTACSEGGKPPSAEPQASDPKENATVLLVETIYFGGDILTMSGEEPSYVEALAVHDGKVVFAGDQKTAMVHQGDNTQLIDLDGKTLMPGFIDAHGHVTQLALALAIANLAAPPYGEADTFDGVKTALKHYIEEKNIPKGQWVLGLGYDTSILPGHPDKALLDDVSTGNPILIIHSSGHIGVVNSKALKLANITADTPKPEGGLIQIGMDGLPNGVLEESAMWPVMLSVPKASEAQELAMLKKSLDSYASFGVTTVQDGRTSPKDLVLLTKAAAQGMLYLDVIAYPAIEMMTEEWQPDFKTYQEYQSGLKLGGVKLSLDGSMPGKTAYLSKPYYIVPEGQGKDYRGYTAFNDEQVNAFVKRAWDNDWQILIHTNADAAGDQMLNAVKALGDTSDKDWRPVMIHGQAAREDQLDDMKDLGVLVSFEMTHPFLFGDYYVNSVFGKERGERNNPAGSALKRDINYTFHNDAPVVVPDVLMTAWVGVNRLTRSNKVIGPEQRVSAYEAMKALTVYAAYQNFEEDIKGTLEAGKLADMVILDKNPLKVDPTEIKDIEVVNTIKEDKVVWPRP